MNILFISRATLFSNPGGDTIQIINTAECLRKLGVQIDIRLTNEPIDYSQFDLIHFFNIIRPSDMLHHIKRSRKPYVVSTIFVDYYEYEKKNSKGIRKFIAGFFSSDTIEYLKVLTRSIVNNEKIISPSYIFLGQKKSVKKVILGARMLLPNSENEYRRLVSQYQIIQNYKIIPNGINESLFSHSEEIMTLKEDDLVICVARIEPLKNQLNLINALNDTRFRLLIIGKPSMNQKEYYIKCKERAASNISFIDYIPQGALVKYYAKAKVHVLPSWFETTGLSSLEAAAMSCNIVITDKGDAKEYFKDYAYYCDPESPESIFRAVKNAAAGLISKELIQMIISRYTWTVAAEKTLEAYKKILSISV
ncbi:MAG: glycosyltransferase family 4 protein [Bacteroidetes bacterium]|nr:MAG: glycosyltransferase family 4 protein [Bacteroidota bacterium]